MANRWYRPKHQPLKVLNLFRKAWRDQKGTQDDPLLVSFFSPSSPSSMFKFVNLYNIENYRLLHYFGKLLLFLWQNYSEYHILSLNSSFHLPISWCLLSSPQKHIKVGPIISSGGTRFFFFFCGGHRGGKMRFWGGKNPKSCRKWLILAIFSSDGEGASGGRASNWGAFPPWPPLDAGATTIKRKPTQGT